MNCKTQSGIGTWARNRSTTSSPRWIDGVEQSVRGSHESNGFPFRNCHFAAERRRAERRISPSLAAYHCGRALFPRLNTVRDISATGAYLETQERWEPGEVIALTLQRSGPLERENSFMVQAKAVRWDDHGVATSYLFWPDGGADLRPVAKPSQECV